MNRPYFHEWKNGRKAGRFLPQATQRKIILQSNASGDPEPKATVFAEATIFSTPAKKERPLQCLQRSVFHLAYNAGSIRDRSPSIQLVFRVDVGAV